ncbi:MAG: response regulator [Planctomycetes bacterium]|nr:response regulator [Planctomycetota bacterium]MBI3843707.1 response regulator [Planctomycetota bacterium]
MLTGRKPPWATSVLVVEDDEDLRRRLRDSLLMRGFFVEAAANEREAIRLLDRLRRDVVVTAVEKLAILRGGGLDDPAPAVVVVDDDETLRQRFDSQQIANRIEEAVAGSATVRDPSLR